MTRREEREMAFALCFEMELSHESAETVMEGAVEIREEQVPEFCSRVVFGVEKELSVIDGHIEKNVRKGWTKSRISKVALAILRVAIYEMLFEEDVPHSVSINEAVELCKIYGDKDAPGFVNGMLSSVDKSLVQENG